MGRRGHRVTVVMPETTIHIGPGKHFETLTYPVPYDKAYIDSVMSTHKDIMKKSAYPLMGKIKKLRQFWIISDLLHISADKLLFNASLISHLAQQITTAPLT
ncbi:UDP-glucuronosyltransferase 1A4-like [Oreochromis aureus]|uniref:UDP-glucuronosyltransferase 1A4-like n=1 Tax=Oreochromis aureus TaxID=47969 RepID=UPI0019540A32|nr:UDP-glucuronosyltransferase 1A4-like [Oreochromis aureus]